MVTKATGPALAVQGKQYDIFSKRFTASFGDGALNSISMQVSIEPGSGDAVKSVGAEAARLLREAADAIEAT